MWGWVALAFALAGAALSAAELLSREHPRSAPAPPGPQRLRKVRWHLGNSKASLALMFVFAGTAAIVAGKTIDPNPNPNPVPNPIPLTLTRQEHRQGEQIRLGRRLGRVQPSHGGARQRVLACVDM
jgi:hypothetical protein